MHTRNLISTNISRYAKTEMNTKLEMLFLMRVYRNKMRSELLDHGTDLAIYTEQGCSEGAISRVTFYKL